MIQSPFHVAIIMDGNGRWARARGRPREWGHRAGARPVRRIVEATPAYGISILTLYAFSSDNWNRPEREVRALLHLFRRYLKSETPALVEQDVRLEVIGRRDRLPPELVKAIEGAERKTAGGSRLLLRLAVDYSSRHALVEAARILQSRQLANALAPESPPWDASRPDPGPDDLVLGREAFRRALARAIHASEAVPDVDLLIRTGGEQRLSDFLLWECAYAELVFLPCLWPDFTQDDLAEALRDFAGRERRFGRVAAAG
ncbi:MAG: polyprenyl diphosphate synthase [Gemmatimonadota bacterium]